MKSIDYTVVKNENNDVFVVINPLSSHNGFAFEKNGLSLLIKCNEDIMILNNVFDNFKTEKFFLVEFGPIGFIKETELSF